MEIAVNYDKGGFSEMCGQETKGEGLSQNEKWGRRDNQDRQPSQGVLLWEMGWLLDTEENYFKDGDVLIAEGLPRKVAPNWKILGQIQRI